MFEPLHPADLDGASHLLAESFHNDPGYAALAAAHDRPATLRALWSFILRVYGADGLTYRDADALSALAYFGPSRPLGWSGWLRAGGLTVPFRMGLRSHRILRRLDRQLVSLLSNPALPEGVHWLHAIAVHPEHQGRGLGTELLSGCLQTSDAPWALLSTNVDRLGWYARHGFAPIGEVILDEGFTSWLLVRPSSR